MKLPKEEKKAKRVAYGGVCLASIVLAFPSGCAMTDSEETDVCRQEQTQQLLLIGHVNRLAQATNANEMVGILCYAYHVRHGAWPKSLRELEMFTKQQLNRDYPKIWDDYRNSSFTPLSDGGLRIVGDKHKIELKEPTR